MAEKDSIQIAPDLPTLSKGFAEGAKIVVNSLKQVSKSASDVKAIGKILQNSGVSDEMRKIANDAETATTAVDNLTENLDDLSSASKKVGKAGSSAKKAFKEFEKLNTLDFSFRQDGKKKKYESLVDWVPDDARNIKEYLEHEKQKLEDSVRRYKKKYDERSQGEDGYLNYKPNIKNTPILYMDHKNPEDALYDENAVKQNVEKHKRVLQQAGKTIDKKIISALQTRERLYSAYQTLQSNIDFETTDFSDQSKNDEAFTYASKMVKIAKEIRSIDANIGATELKGISKIDVTAIQTMTDNLMKQIMSNDTIEQVFNDRFENIKQDYDNFINYLVHLLAKGRDNAKIEDFFGDKFSQKYKDPQLYITDKKSLTDGAANKRKSLNRSDANKTRRILAEQDRYEFVGQMANAIRNGREFDGEDAYKYYLELLKESEYKEFADKILNYEKNDRVSSSPTLNTEKIKGQIEALKERNEALEHAQQLGMKVSEDSTATDTEQSVSDIQKQTEVLKEYIAVAERSEEAISNSTTSHNTDAIKEQTHTLEQTNFEQAKLNQQKQEELDLARKINEEEKKDSSAISDKKEKNVLKFADGTPLNEQEIAALNKYAFIMQKKLGESYNEAQDVAVALELISNIKFGNVEALMDRFNASNTASNAVLKMLTGMDVNNQENRDLALRSINETAYDEIIEKQRAEAERVKAEMEQQGSDFQQKWNKLVEVMLGGDAFAGDSNLAKGKIYKALSSFGKSAEEIINDINKKWLAGELDEKQFNDRHLKAYLNHLNGKKEYYDVLRNVKAGDLNPDSLFEGGETTTYTEEQAQALRDEAKAWDEVIARAKEYYGIKETTLPLANEIDQDEINDALDFNEKIIDLKDKILEQKNKSDEDRTAFNAELNLMLKEDAELFKILNEESVKLASSLKPVQDMVKRISSNSSIAYLEKDSEDSWVKYANAYKEIDDRMGELHDKHHLTNEELEEYITLQVKADKIMNKIISREGGVKGSGEKNKQALENRIRRFFAEDLGFSSDDYREIFKNVMFPMLYEQGQLLYDNEGKKPLRYMAGDVLNYVPISEGVLLPITDVRDSMGGLGAEVDANRLAEINTILSYIKNNANEIADSDFSGQIKVATENVKNYTRKIAEGNESGFCIEQLDEAKAKLSELISMQERLHKVDDTQAGTPASSLSEAPAEQQQNYREEVERITDSIQEQANEIAKTEDAYASVYNILTEMIDVSNRFKKHQFELQDEMYNVDEFMDSYFKTVSSLGDNAILTFDWGLKDWEAFIEGIRSAFREYRKIESAIKNHQGHLGDEQYTKYDLDDLKNDIGSAIGRLFYEGNRVYNYSSNKERVESEIAKLTKGMPKYFEKWVREIADDVITVSLNNRHYQQEKLELEPDNAKLQEEYTELLDRLVEKGKGINLRRTEYGLDIDAREDILGILPLDMKLGDFSNKKTNIGYQEEYLRKLTEQIVQKILPTQVTQEAKEVKSESQSIIDEIDQIINKCQELKDVDKNARTMAVTSAMRDFKTVLTDENLDIDNLTDEQLIRLSEGFWKLENAANKEASEMADGVKEYIRGLLDKFNVEVFGLDGIDFNSDILAKEVIGIGSITNEAMAKVSKTINPYVSRNGQLIKSGVLQVEEGENNGANTAFGDFVHNIKQLKNVGLSDEIIAEILFGSLNKDKIVTVLKSQLPIEEIVKQVLTINPVNMGGNAAYDVEADFENYLRYDVANNETSVEVIEQAENQKQDAMEETAEVAEEVSDRIEDANKEIASDETAAEVVADEERVRDEYEKTADVKEESADRIKKANDKQVSDDKVDEVVKNEQKKADASENSADAVAAAKEKESEAYEKLAETAEKTTSSIEKQSRDSRDIEEAYDRMNSTQDSWMKASIRRTLNGNYGGSSDTESTRLVLSQLKNAHESYDLSRSKNWAWEDEYQWAVKFVNLYEQYRSRDDGTEKSLSKHTALYEKLQPLVEGYKKDLQAVLDFKPTNDMVDDKTAAPLPVHQQSDAFERERDIVSSVVQSEINDLGELDKKIGATTDAVDIKTNAFRQEEQVVTGTVQREISDLTLLSSWILSVTDDIEKLSLAISSIPEFKTNLDDDGNKTSNLKLYKQLSDITQAVSGLDVVVLKNLYDWIDDLNKLRIKKGFINSINTLATSIDNLVKKMNGLDVSDNNFLSSIKDLVNQGDALSNLVRVMNATKKEIEKAEKAAKESSDIAEQQEAQEAYEETALVVVDAKQKEQEVHEEVADAATKAALEVVQAEEKKQNACEEIIRDISGHSASDNKNSKHFDEHNLKVLRQRGSLDSENGALVTYETAEGQTVTALQRLGASGEIITDAVSPAITNFETLKKKVKETFTELVNLQAQLQLEQSRFGEHYDTSAIDKRIADKTAALELLMAHADLYATDKQYAIEYSQFLEDYGQIRDDILNKRDIQFAANEAKTRQSEAQQSKKLEELKSKYTKRLSAVHEKFSFTKEYSAAQNAISGLTNTDDVNDVEKAFNELESLINSFKQNVKKSASLDPIFSALKTQSSVEDIVESYIVKFIKLGYSANDAATKVKALSDAASNIKDVDIETPEGMGNLGAYLQTFNTESEKLDREAKAVKERESAYAKLIETYDRYLSLKAKEKAEVLTDDQKKELAELKAERERLERIVKGPKTNAPQVSQPATVTQTKYEGIKNNEDTLAAKYDKIEEDIQNHITDTDKVMKDIISAIAKKEIEGSDDILEYYTGEIEKLNNRLKESKTYTPDVFEKYEKDIAAIFDELARTVAGNVAPEKVKGEMEKYFMSIGASATELGKFDEINKKMTAEFTDQEGKIRKVTLQYNYLTKAIQIVRDVSNEGQFEANKLAKRFKEHAASLLQQFLAFASFREIFEKIRQGTTYVRELDVALTEMRKVSDETIQSLKQFQSESFDVASGIGTTATEIQNSAADFMRLGYTLKEASELAKDANVYANVGDMEIDEATEHMISSIKAWESEFGSEVEASRAIIDRYNEVGNNFAISSAEIGSAMEKSAAALKAGGNTLNESLGLLVSANVIQQDADTVAAAMKILSLRVRGAKAELEEMGEETDNLASSSSKMREELMALTGVDIMIDENTFKSTTKIIQELGAVYDSLTDVSRAALLEKIAGKNRASTVEGLLQNYQLIDEVIKSAENAEGSAAEENLRYLDSIEGRIAQFQNSVQEFWHNLISSETVKMVVGAATKIMSVLADIVAVLGEGGVFTVGLSALLGAHGLLNKLSDEENDSLLADIYKLVVKGTFKENNDTDDKTNAKTFGKIFTTISKGANEAKVAIKGLGQDAKGFDKLKAGASAFNKTLGSSIGIIGKFAIGIGVVAGVYALFERLNESISETAEKSESFSNAINEAMSGMTSNTSTLASLNDEYQELSKGVSNLGKNVSLSSEEYERYKDIVSQVSGIMPNMTTYFNSQGERIGFVKGKLADLNAEYETYLQNQAKKFMVEGDSNGNTVQDVLDNYANNSTGETNGWEKFKTFFKQFFGFYEEDDVATDDLISILEGLLNKSQEGVSEYLSSYDRHNGTKATTYNNALIEAVRGILGYSSEDVAKMTEEEFNALQQIIASKLETLTNGKELDMNQITSVLFQSAYSKDAFWSLGEDLRNVVSTMLSSINTGVWESFEWDTQSATELNSFVNRLIEAVASNKNGVADAWNSLFELNIDELPAKTYVAQVNTYIDTIASALELDSEGKKQFMISLGFDFTSETGSNIDGLYKRIKQTVPGISNDVLEPFTLSDLEIGAKIAEDVAKQVEKEISEIEAYIDTEAQRMTDFGLDVYKDSVLRNSLYSVFGNIDMDNRQVINWTKEQIEASKEALKDIKYYDDEGNFIESYYDQLKESAENGYTTIDTVFGDFIDNIEGYGDVTAIAFSHIVNNDDGTVEFLGQKTAEEYLYGILDVAKESGDLSLDHILELDKRGYDADVYNDQGEKIGKTYIHGIIAGFNQYADGISKLMHFTGDYGSIALAYDAIDKLGASVLKKQIDIYKYLGEDAVQNVQDVYKSLDLLKEGPNSPVLGIKSLDSTFEEKTNVYIEKVNDLKIALGKINDGTLTNGELEDLMEQFPDWEFDTENLTGSIDDLLHNMNTDMIEDFADQFGEIDSESDRVAIEKFMNAVLELGSTVGNTTFALDISTEREGIESVTTALQESVSSTGLSSESIANLKDRYAELEEQGYSLDSMFEETTNGIHINRKAINELENAYETQKMQEFNNEIARLEDRYDELTAQIQITTDVVQLSDLYSQRSDIIDQINDIGILASQYEGLTSAYHNWENVSSAGNERDMYEGVISGREEMEKEMERGWFDDNTIAFLELMTGRTLSTEDFAEQKKAYQSLYDAIGKTEFNIWDFFTVNDDNESTAEGVFNFFDTIKSVVGETAAWIDDEGRYHFDFGKVFFDKDGIQYHGDAAVAQILGISEELVQIILRAADDAGFTINMESAYTELADFKDEVAAFNDRLKALGATEHTFNINSTSIKNLEIQLEEAQAAYAYLRSAECNIKVSDEDLQNTKLLIASIIRQKQELEGKLLIIGVHIDQEEADSNVEKSILAMQNYINANYDLEVGLATGDSVDQTTEKLQTSIRSLKEMDTNISATLGLDDEEFQTALDQVDAAIEADAHIPQEALDIIEQKIREITPQMLVDAGVTDETVLKMVEDIVAAEKDATVDVTLNPDDTAIRSYLSTLHIPDKSILFKPDTREIDQWANDFKNRRFDKTITISYTGTESSTSSARERNYYGTSRAQGTAISTWSNHYPSIGAYASGSSDWRLPRNEDALVNEIGTESIVRNGKWFPIPGGAHVEHLKRGDIIFNAEQTDELMSAGKVTSGGGHGKLAYANGTAHNMMNSYYGSSGNGVGKIEVSTTVYTDSNGKKHKTSDDNDEFEETFDWIERKIKEVERQIDNLDQTASATYKSWATRNTALASEMSKVSEEIAIQQAAYHRYMQEANSTGLSDYYKALVQQGAIDIQTIKDEKLAEQIQKYQEFYDKAIETQDAIRDLQDSLADLAKTKFDNVVKQYDDRLSAIEHETNIINSLIEQTENSGHIVSEQYYKELINQEKKNKSLLEQEYSSLQAALAEAMRTGNIQENSEEWHSMQQELNGVQEAIIESNTAIIEFQNNIRQLKWDAFDRLQDKISNITSEAEFLISLMEDSDLFDDKGQLTNTGMATMGLHGQNYNVYMAQADKYAEEMANLDKEYSDDLYNTNYLERRQELLELQQDSILAAQDEKNAIRDLVEEGINLELESLQKLIDEYNKAQENARDLYEYQKNIQEQVENISSLEKQLSAYQVDTSEENKQRIQQIKVQLEEAREDLEETEMEHALSETQKMLDELYSNYEIILNERLDNIDMLLTDMIDSINANSSSISETITTEANKVGYDISESLQSIWNSEGNATSVITKYGDNFCSQLTSVNNVLNAIKEEIHKMANESDTESDSQIKEEVKNPSKNENTTPAAPSTPPKNETTQKPQNSSASGTSIKVGGRINAGSALIYEHVGDTTGNTQYYKKDPIYTVLAEESGYVKVRHHSLSKGVTGWFKKSDIKAYKTGGLADETGLAWLDGTKSKPEMVLNSTDTENFIELTDTLRRLTKEDSTLFSEDWTNNADNLIANMQPMFDALTTATTPNLIPYNSNQNMNNVFNMTFELHDVTNGEQIINYLIKSDRFENAVKAMTVDRLAGGSKFSKSKYHKNI